jgi:Heme NO binding.
MYIFCTQHRNTAVYSQETRQKAGLMYGLVNKAIEDLICKEFGEDKWDEIVEDSDIGVDGFISMDNYDDDITYSLVASISKILGLSPEQVLQTFGKFWTTYTASKGYESILLMTGDNIEEFLFNIDELHSRITVTYPEMTPPKFTTHKITDNHFELEYRSDRSGLAPMVIGLLEGIGERFNKEVSVSQISTIESDGVDKFSFIIN